MQRLILTVHFIVLALAASSPCLGAPHVATAELNAAPSDAELQAWLNEHAWRYRAEPMYILQHVFVDPRRHENLDAELARVWRALSDEGAGQASSIRPAYLEGGATQISRSFGEDFEQMLRDIPIAAWSGPLQSTRGIHFVKIERRTSGRTLQLEEARAAVTRDLLRARTSIRVASAAQGEEEAVRREQPAL